MSYDRDKLRIDADFEYDYMKSMLRITCSSSSDTSVAVHTSHGKVKIDMITKFSNAKSVSDTAGELRKIADELDHHADILNIDK